MKNIKITKAALKATENLVLAMAHRQTVEPIVRAYQTEILKENKYIDVETGEAVLDPLSFFETSDKDFADYCEKQHYAAIKAGFKVEKDYCPLLIAQDLERKAENEFLKQTDYMHHLYKHCFSRMDIRQKCIKLTLEFILSRNEARNITKQNLLNSIKKG